MVKTQLFEEIQKGKLKLLGKSAFICFLIGFLISLLNDFFGAFFVFGSALMLFTLLHFGLIKRT